MTKICLKCSMQALHARACTECQDSTGQKYPITEMADKVFSDISFVDVGMATKPEAGKYAFLQ